MGKLSGEQDYFGRASSALSNLDEGRFKNVSLSRPRTHARHRYKSKRKAFTKSGRKWADDLGKKTIEANFKKMIRYCKVIRVIAHSQVRRILMLLIPFATRDVLAALLRLSGLWCRKK